MSVHSIGGLVLFNLFLLAVGASVLWALRGWRSWGELIRLAGVAYMLGVAVFGSLLVVELVVGLRAGFAALLLSGGGIVVAGLSAGHLSGRSRPARCGSWRPGGSALAAVCVAAAAVYFEALFRAGRLKGLIEWDAWSFWVPKAKAIYYFGGLDAQFFGGLPGPTYPPLIPALHASAFHFMGSPDVVSLHLQVWFLFVGFVGAVVGLLSTRVGWWLLWPFVLLFLVTEAGLQPLADLPLAYFLASGALLVAIWLVEGEGWQLAGAGVLLGAATLTKREGLMLAACILAAAFLASLPRWRTRWLPFAVASALAGGLAVTWIAYFSARGYTGWGADAGGFGLFANAERAWPSLELAVSGYFDYDYWFVIPIVSVAAVAIALVAGARLLPVFSLLVLGLFLAGFTWMTWAFPSLPITKDGAVNPIMRVMRSAEAVSIVLAPLLLQTALSASRGESRRRLHVSPALASARWLIRTESGWPWLLVPVAALVYPLSNLAGGLPRFPTRSECIRPATEARAIEAVFGHLGSLQEAVGLRAKAARVGFQRVQVVHDGCGRYKVVIEGIPSLAVGRELLAEAQSVGLAGKLEGG